MRLAAGEIESFHAAGFLTRHRAGMSGRIGTDGNNCEPARLRDGFGP